MGEQGPGGEKQDREQVGRPGCVRGLEGGRVRTARNKGEKQFRGDVHGGDMERAQGARTVALPGEEKKSTDPRMFAKPFVIHPKNAGVAATDGFFFAGAQSSRGRQIHGN